MYDLDEPNVTLACATGYRNYWEYYDNECYEEEYEKEWEWDEI